MRAEVAQIKEDRAVKEAKTAQVALEKLFFNIVNLFTDCGALRKERFLRLILKNELLEPLDKYALGMNWHINREDTLLLISSNPQIRTIQLKFGETHVSILPLHEPLTSEIRSFGLRVRNQPPVGPGIILNIINIPLKALRDEEHKTNLGL